MPDIFVSYAHVDDEPLRPARIGWVTTFVDNLKGELARCLGRREAFELWMDYELRGNQSISGEVKAKVQSARAFLMFLSPGYEASTWCQEELSLFLEAAGAAAGRVYIIRLNDTATPEPLAREEIKGYEFWERDRSNRVRRFASPEPSPEERVYYKVLGDVAYDLTDFFNTSAQATPAAGVEVVEDTGQPTVYLAQVPASLSEKRNQVRRHLEQLNVRVLPASQLPLANAGETIDNMLACSSLYVQLLSDDPGQQLPVFQYQRAEACDIPVMQWRSRTLDESGIDDEEHLALLHGSRVIASSLVDFQALVKERLFAKPEPSRKRNGEELLVFVDAGQEDLSLAYETSSALQDNGIGYSMPVQTEHGIDPTDIRLDYEANVLNCDVVLMLYQKGPVTQVRKRLLECNRLRAKRESPFRMLAVCTDSDVIEPLNLGLPRMKVFDTPEPCPSNCVKAVLDAVEP